MVAIDMCARPASRTVQRAGAYPDALSGGLRQRIMIAMALSCSPKLLLCDEPTTALDVTVQHQVLRLLEQLCEDHETALVFVTHDLGVVNQTCRELAVMYAGEIVERGRVKDVFADPRHPYTKGLLRLGTRFRPARGGSWCRSPGFAPNLADRPNRSPFQPRCAFAVEHCATTRPKLARGSCRGARRPASKQRASSQGATSDGRHGG